jgi:twinfilin-like protein
LATPKTWAWNRYIFLGWIDWRVRERMVYSTGKSWMRVVAERDAGLVIGRSLEATEPSEITVEMLGGGGSEEVVAETKPSNSGFARPKRPGRR